MEKNNKKTVFYNIRENIKAVQSVSCVYVVAYRPAVPHPGLPYSSRSGTTEIRAKQALEPGSAFLRPGTYRKQCRTCMLLAITRENAI